ncbi:GDSL esterase/lipase At5g14450-like isoform X3 [Cucurbita pepo subsp. pepo]|uniref:GDSL esterase/lipase At5g14450-like isoform X3 n=1 Tax=Cucurbita pepo subsp. pepo TaxID=3664 RepID=UPI000C9D7A1E|nr:GDSL esterase/lipase At5g14450-like isoform X3 [Cucurbita pepo subsp. pepo]
MGLLKLRRLLVVLILGLLIGVTTAGGGSGKCGFPAVYNFGDSNSDTGGISAAFNAIQPPNGETFFRRPSGRACDGRLIVDFIDKTSIPIKRIARPQEFSKALYTFDIGQNDLAYGYQHSSEEQVRASIPDILNTFSEAVQQLYKEGARYFWVHNTGPIGCLPYSILYNKSPDNRDSNGCVESQNEVSREFNRQLKSRLLKLGKKLPVARIIHIDMYSAKYLLITEAKTQGFVKNPVKFCCGSYYGYHIDCGKREVVNGTVYGNPCKDPSRHISWDGIHYSEAANLWIANHILNGSFSDPPLPIDKACRAPSYA